jgi:hypothetical protein
MGPPQHLLATHRSRNRPFGQQPLAHVLAGHEMGQHGLGRLRRNMTNCDSARSLRNARRCTDCARGAKSEMKSFTAFRRSSALTDRDVRLTVIVGSALGSARSHSASASWKAFTAQPPPIVSSSGLKSRQSQSSTTRAIRNCEQRQLAKLILAELIASKASEESTAPASGRLTRAARLLLHNQ